MAVTDNLVTVLLKIEFQYICDCNYYVAINFQNLNHLVGYWSNLAQWVSGSASVTHS